MEHNLKPETLLVTGATGFVGRPLCSNLIRKGLHVRAEVHTSNKQVDNNELVYISDINGQTDWTNALQGIKVIIHLAARVHVMNDTANDALAEFRKVNVAGTLNLARQAVKAGVKRFIFISSVKVNGEATLLGHPFTAEDKPNPLDPYGISKREAEDALRQLAHDTGLEVVIIRPPLIYGPGVKANFLNMMSFLDKNIPLPLGSIHNQRSLLAVDNLIDLIITCIHHPAAANQTFLASDSEDLSTTELLKRTATALNKKVWLINIPSFLLKWCLTLIGKKAVSQRLCSSLQVDISKTCELLDWHPPVTINEALHKTALYYRQHLND
jgi:nucleoside-diphosphate-sugar epimerase